MKRRWCQRVTGKRKVGSHVFEQYCNGVLRRLYVRGMTNGKAWLNPSVYYECEDCKRLYKVDDAGISVVVKSLLDGVEDPE